MALGPNWRGPVGSTGSPTSVMAYIGDAAILGLLLAGKRIPMNADSCHGRYRDRLLRLDATLSSNRQPRAHQRHSAQFGGIDGPSTPLHL